MNFRGARSMLLNFEGNDDILPPQIVSVPPGLIASSSDSTHASSGTRFIFLIKDTMQQLTLEVISHFGATILTKISHLFDLYMEILIKALPGPSEDENLAENKEYVYYKDEIDSQQLGHLGTVFTIADQLLSVVVSRIWSKQSELKEPEPGLDAQIYLHGIGEDLYWDSQPLASLPFQALFGKLQHLATVAGDITSVIITRAIKTFSARGINPHNALPEDEWFVNTAKTAINKLLLKTSNSEASDIDDEHITLHDKIISDSDDTGSYVPSIESSDSFASANIGEVESLNYFTDPKA
ncbi:hypothetical protein GIB67_002434 [Kingdonia uniflora]|uniref:Uncharacterized protein n=1 Tax=Kingdonia uniflora TaxID=39325 RepID=A0A7J7KY58_9MAGN|nr:hypothetical protein GIB67_002434 [Kingdonia uniflora]